jgi:hypothetical protein
MRHFYLAGWMRGMWWLNTLLFLGLAVMYSTDGWSRLETVAVPVLIVSAGLNAYELWRGARRPLVSMSDEEIVTRRWSFASKDQRITRSDVYQIIWDTPQTVCLRLRSGLTTAVQIRGLSRDDKRVVVERLRSWCAVA